MNVFFFSSRRRHTRCGRDWSSDVCSSDLGDATKEKSAADYHNALVYDTLNNLYYHPYWKGDSLFFKEFRLSENGDTTHRSEERRVGKECRFRFTLSYR